MAVKGSEMGAVNVFVGFLALVLLHCCVAPSFVSAQGTWQVIQPNAGISTMHAAVTRYDTVILLDRTNIGPTQIKLPGGRCRNQTQERVSKIDCYAHSVMMDASNGAVRALFVLTDTWCSSGQFFDNGVLVQTGGDFEGNKKIRKLYPCPVTDNCDWVELTEELNIGRWYASNQILPSGIQQIIMGGRGTATYEFYPKRVAGEGSFALGMLGGSDNLYPFVFLLPNADLFIFANRDSVQLNYNTGKVIRYFPTLLPNPRNYPSAGSAAMLPLTFADAFTTAEIVVCGGAAANASKSNNVDAIASINCGRIVATSATSVWATENMPMPRNMGDMLNLPNGQVLIINGAGKGFSGWGKASDPVLNPVNYDPKAAAGSRFTTFAPTTIPRMYHSTASVLSDGRILVAGSNTHQFYTYTGIFPTELRVECFSPPYLAAGNDAVRPTITVIPLSVKYNQVFGVTFTVGTRVGAVTAYQNSAPFSTHSFAQGQRSLQLATTVPLNVGGGAWSVQVTSPPNKNIAPLAYYIFVIVQNNIPSRGKWLKQLS